MTTTIDGAPAATLVGTAPGSKQGHVALQQLTADTVVQFRKIEIKELPPTPSLPDSAEQALPALAGAWKGEFVQKIANGKPAELKLDCKVVNEQIAGKRFLRQRIQHGNTGDLQVTGYDPQTGVFRNWFFNAHGMALGPSIGRWDAAARTITWTNLPEADTVGVKTVRFVDANTVTWSVVFRNKAGTTLYEGEGRMTRAAEPVEIDETLSPGPAAPELAVLNRLVGDWQTSGTLKAPDAVNLPFTTRIATRSVLGGRLITAHETGLPGHPDTYWLATFDAKLKAYRFWMFNADGNVMELGGGWDDKAQTMTWNSAGPDGSRTTGTWRWADPNRREWTTVTKDAGGKTTLDVQAVSTRTAPQPPLAVAPFDAAKAKEFQDAWATHLGVKPEYENSVGMKFRLIPPGKFRMGSTKEEWTPC